MFDPSKIGERTHWFTTDDLPMETKAHAHNIQATEKKLIAR